MSKNNKNLENAFKKTMKKHKGNRKAQVITIIVFGLIALGSYLFGNDFISNKEIGPVTGQLEVSYLDGYVGGYDDRCVQRQYLY